MGKSQAEGFKAELRRQMKVIVPAGKDKKFHLLHAAFPRLKITTNFDCLIETYAPRGVHVTVACGYEKEKLERWFSLRLEENVLLKIHGCITDLHSIVLRAEQYQRLYGHEHSFDAAAVLPGFLQRVFTNSQVVFIGCSLEQDRTAMILQDIQDKPRHYAVMKLPDTDEKKTLLTRPVERPGPVHHFCPAL